MSNPLDEEQVLSERIKNDSAQEIVRVGYLGMARENKGFDLLPDIIEATAALIDGPLEWLMFMNPGAMPEVNSRLQADPSVHFVGHVFPAKDAYSQVDLVLCPSRQESFGRVAAEAMMNGLVVIGSRIPAYEQLLASTAADSLFDIDDPATAARLIARMVRNPKLRAAVGALNAQEAAQFSVSRIVPEFEDVLAESARLASTR